ncbi:MAG: SDR family oxidoreductase [Pyrinomonadaceae bacterium]|nr:SDR family oxidoreductase [Pyrinomonadaceae bacterium]
MKNEETKTKIVVIGGSGLIGSKLIPKLNEHGYEAVAASPETGVNTLTGEGLDEVLKGADVVVDVSNSPSFEEQAATDFFTKSTTNLLNAEAAAGVKHHVALSVVGTDTLAEKDGIGGYFRAKLAQENLIKQSPVPYSIVHATQFFEFIKMLADSSSDGENVRVAPIQVQPMAADDVAKAVGRVAAGTPINGTVEVAGPEVFRLDEFIRAGLDARKDRRNIVVDENAGYIGARIPEKTLVPAGDANLGMTRLADWLAVPANVNPPQTAKATSGVATSSPR